MDLAEVISEIFIQAGEGGCFGSASARFVIQNYLSGAAS